MCSFKSENCIIKFREVWKMKEDWILVQLLVCTVQMRSVPVTKKANKCCPCYRSAEMTVSFILACGLPRHINLGMRRQDTGLGKVLIQLASYILTTRSVYTTHQHETVLNIPNKGQIAINIFVFNSMEWINIGRISFPNFGIK